MLVLVWKEKERERERGRERQGGRERESEWEWERNGQEYLLMWIDHFECIIMVCFHCFFFYFTCTTLVFMIVFQKQKCKKFVCCVLVKLLTSNIIHEFFLHEHKCILLTFCSERVKNKVKQINKSPKMQQQMTSKLVTFLPSLIHCLTNS